MSLFLISLFIGFAQAVIFGNDDRVDTRFASVLAQELGSSVPALVQKNRIQKWGEGKVKLTGTSMRQFGFCEDSSFSEESIIANCSASFIGKDLVLTAAHCFDQKQYACETYAVVFDYQRSSSNANEHILDEKSVYHCKKIVYSKFDPMIVGEDLAIIQLDREVKNRTPIKLNTEVRLKVGEPLMMIGYPLGISQKAVEIGEVLEVNKKDVSFKNTLDSFSVNSGGPIFNLVGEQVGVLVRGTGTNTTERSGCLDWTIAGNKDFSDANDLSSLKVILRELRH